MENLDKDLTLLERYLDKELSAEEQAAVEKRLEEDAAFAELYQVSQEAVQAIHAYGEDQTRELLRRIHEEEKATPDAGEEKVRRLPGRQLLALAAALALLISAALWLFNQPASADSVFRQYYTIPTPDQIRNGLNSDPLLSDAEKLYQEGNFSGTLTLLDEYRRKYPTSGKVLTLLGISQMEVKDYPGAERTFRELAALPGFNDRGTWYLALLFLRQERFAAARAELTRLTSGEVTATPARQAEAAGLLKAMEHLPR